MVAKRKYALIVMILISATAFAQGHVSVHDDDPAYPEVHDPSVAVCGGTWYMFTTGYRLNMLVSEDHNNWEKAGHVFDTTPQWAVKMVPGYTGHTWAPDIQQNNGTYYLYYSCSTFGKNTSAIGVATNNTLDPDSPDYKWVDHGCVVNSVAGRDLWNAIDPNMAFDDEGNGWLCFGSFWGGLKVVKLDSTLTRPAEPQVWYPVCRRPEGTAEDTSTTDEAIKADPRGKDFDPGNGAVEAPYIIKHGVYYYLFASYDLCCRGPKSTYMTVVGRSKNIYGPYVDAEGVSLMQGGGTVVVKGNDRYAGIGHCAIIHEDGADILFCHAYDKQFNYNSRLIVRKIDWSEDGWPSIEL